MENNFLYNKPNNNKIFDDRESIYLKNVSKPVILPSVGFKSPGFIEPEFKPPEYIEFKPLYLDKNNLKMSKPDWTPDFSEKFDVIGDSINLALYTLNMSWSEYNSCDVSSLKSQRRIDYSSEKIWAFNILICYKKNTSINLPNLSPIKRLN
jgi:hypothetical protein